MVENKGAIMTEGTDLPPDNKSAVEDQISNVTETYRKLEETVDIDNQKHNQHIDTEANTNEDTKNVTNKLEFNKPDEGNATLSNYVQNIMNTNGGLANDKADKDATLLAESRTIVRFSPVMRQSLAAMSSILLSFTAGLTSGYSGILLPQLERPGSPILIDETTKSWIAAMAALPMAPGCLISGWLMEMFGRKTSHYILCAPFLIGWVLISCANNLTLMLLGRFFTGFCVGLLGPLGPVYIGETSDPKYRGFFLAAVSLAIAIGILVAHLLGTFLSWQITAGISAIFPVVTVVLLTFIPESPTWLINQGKVEAGAQAFTWLRGATPEANAELKGLIDKKKLQDSEPKMSMKEKLISLKSPELLKPLGIMILFFVTCQFSGVNAVAFYSIEIVEKAVGKGLDHYMVMLIIDALRTVASVIACVICKQYGRRPLCFISGIFTALSMVALSMFLHWKPPNMAWLPLIFLMVYICAISIGLVPLPWIMCGEVFPARVRGLGSGISSATTFLAFFVVVKTAPAMLSTFGEVITFLSYGLVAIIGTGILYFILPETRGKSLQEIEEKFRRKR
ncbi:facilitated trehalose transporter Tret1-2 homolog isoform X2 [Plodia interpunctella]|nr:facilitated trehalose transporter Tret1-2 homolog isoform X2 [Plodia interpunctella]XP_053618678.1 facilitated trehalose transporter Tret1-2 homolog isoform X2 [Plodia interpunctella]XP_053618679.1 facilitated trehalose transporter Tret1-2 homolog isoform X2 [Plodia interpunctella]XP_053618680.1 facilitated trehalose transporter Tret1-2 homolog isoform X2 [Plodia interpunctella]XP_053618681.1 facilitated trehalose transporter Tret1-2 homolog isoform X2 [Plodia interpunctella]